MSAQPYALRLADELQSCPGAVADAAAAELRRLHKENELLKNDIAGEKTVISTAKHEKIVLEFETANGALEQALAVAVGALAVNQASWPEKDAAIATARQTLGGNHD